MNADARDEAAVVDVFVSYSNKDRSNVARLVSQLRRAGLTVWWDRDIGAGASFREDIEKSLSAARIVLVCWTEASAASDFVRQEASVAQQLATYIPVLLEAREPPIGFREENAIDLRLWDLYATDQQPLDDAVAKIGDRLTRRLHSDKTERWYSHVRRLTEAVLAVALVIALAAAILWLAGDFRPLMLFEAYALRTALAVAAGSAAVFVYGALTGRGYAGRGRLRRLGSFLTAGLAAWILLPWAEPGLSPGPLNVTGPDRLSMRHSHVDGVAAPPEAADRTTTSIIARMTVIRDGRRTTADVSELVLFVKVGRQTYEFRPNKFTELLGGKRDGWIPAKGIIELPQVFTPDSPAEIRFLPEDSLSWGEFVADLLQNGRDGISARMRVRLNGTIVIEKRCTISEAPGMLSKIEALIARKDRGPNGIPFDCDEENLPQQQR